MGKQQKPKSGQTRNDARQSGKAAKKRAGSRGSRPTTVPEVNKILMGGGLYRKWEKVIDGKLKGLPDRTGS